MRKLSLKLFKNSSDCVFLSSVGVAKVVTVKGKDCVEEVQSVCVVVMSGFPVTGVLVPQLHYFTGSIFQSLLFNYL